MHNSPVGGNIPVMTPRLRTLIDHASRLAETDAVLLRRFATARDPQAFAELVRRYGRLVWGQCRHLLSSEADADDAFQATFLTLANAARTLRDTNKLGPWLHGIAYRVCQQVKRTSARRIKREKAGAKAEATSPLPDSAWDQAFAAVHDELAKLPDTLRVPFVLCVLEGKGTTEAAAQLGLKVGTLSSRLSRAKQAMLDRLSARGLTAGLAAVGAVAVGVSNAPAGVIGKACDLAAGGAVPANILSLSHGVLNMVTLSAKRWAMAVLLGCGLAVGVGGVITANGQDKKPAPKPMQSPTDQLKRLEAEAEQKKLDAQKAEAELKKAQEDAERAALQERRMKDEEVLRQQNADRRENDRYLEAKLAEKKAGPEFRYHGQLAGYAPTPEEFEETVRKIEAEGYTFVAIFDMKGMTKAKDGVVPTLVFRRNSAGNAAARVAAIERLTHRDEAFGTRDEGKRTDPEKALRAQIDQLTQQLDDLKAAKAAQRAEAVFDLKSVGGDAVSGSKLLTTLIRAKFGDAAAGALIFDTHGTVISVSGGTQEQLKWLVDTVSGLGTPAPKSSPK